MVLITMSRFRKDDADRSPTAIYLLCGLSLIFFLVVKALPLDESERTRQSILASRFMGEATRVLEECRIEKGLPIDETTDPNRTGLIGLEFSPLTTTKGLLPAKRTTTNPEMAALVVHLLKEAGAREGDSVAIGASGSFPGLILATLSASKALELQPLIIYSLGTSQWGANDPEFHWLRMESCLREAGLFDFSPVAVSLGGERDTGEDWPPELRSQMEAEIDRRGYLLLKKPDLRQNVEARLKLYQAAANTVNLRAFINIGGAWANLGESHQILKWKPGLVRAQTLPDQEKRGVAYEMVALGVPVIHLLYIKGLVERHGLPWDPIPLPVPGQGFGRRTTYAFPVAAALYFTLLFLAVLLRKRLH